MTTYAGRGLLLKISDDGETPSFLTLGAARTTVFDIANDPVETTALGNDGARSYSGIAGDRGGRIAVQGIFKDSAAEEILRAVAEQAIQRRYRLVFPNGDVYEADFIVESYRREGSHDGLEMFSASLVRSGGGVWTAA